MNKVKSMVIMLISLIIFFTLVVPAHGKIAPSMDSENIGEIILVGDVSGSQRSADPNRRMLEAIKLGVDLAPTNSRVGFVAVNHDVQLQVSSINTGDYQERSNIKKSIDSTVYDGNTNLLVGLETANNMFQSEDRKHIVLLADIFEGGLTGGNPVQENELGQRIDEFINACVENEITVDFVLQNQSPESSELGTKFLTIPEKTKGKIIYIEKSREYAAGIEEIYFSSYLYTYYPISGISSNNITQQIPIHIPINHPSRTRIYVSANTPAGSVSLVHGGSTDIKEESNSSYTMFFMEDPNFRELSLGVTPGEKKTKVYTILDYEPVVEVSVKSRLLGKKKELQQMADIAVDIRNRNTENSMLKGIVIEEVAPSIGLETPSGQSLEITEYSLVDDELQFTVPIEEFGDYKLNIDFIQDDFILPLGEAMVNIPSVIPKKNPIPLAIIAAIIIGALLILLALLFRKKKKMITHRGAVELREEYGFTGRLQIASVLSESTQKEIRPFNFLLDEIRRERRITLEEIYAASGYPNIFKDADKIIVTPGPPDSIVVMNQSDATLIVAGREYGKRESVHLYPDDKVYIVFEENVDEVEIYYRRTMNTNRNKGQVQIGY